MEQYKFPSKFVSTQFVKYVDDHEIRGIVGSLGNTLSERFKGEDLVLLGQLKGSFMFLADLAREIKGVNLLIDFVELKAVGREKNSPGTIIIKKDVSTDISNKHVLIVEEVIDTGRALIFLKERLRLSSPKSVQVVTLFDKTYKRSVSISADYVGKKIEDHFIVGYGLDLDHYGRNLKDVYYLKYPN